jgi:hypothetical protein
MAQGKLLGFIVSHRGIEANPEKINAITTMDGCSKDDQGRPEAHWLHGSFEPIHLPTWRKGTTLLQVAQAPR